MKFTARIMTFVAAALFSVAAHSAAEPIRVGVILPLSGGSGPQGKHILESIEVVAALINESGGVLKRPIVIEARDDESTPAVGVSRANELVSAGVSVIIEGWNSPVTLAMQPVISRAGVLDITAVSKADPILSGEGNPLAIRLNSSNSQDGAVIAAWLAQKAKARRIAFMTENDAYGNGAQASIEEELRKLGHEYEKVAEEKFPFAQADFRVAMTNVATARPDATVLINANEGLGMPAMLRQARQARLKGELVTAVGTIAPSVLEVAGRAAEGIVGADIYFPDVEPFASSPANQRYVARLQEMYKTTPDKYRALGAAALQVWALAANELGTLDREAIAKRIRGGTFDDTVFGRLAFEPNGQAQTRHYVFTVKDGKMIVEQ